MKNAVKVTGAEQGCGLACGKCFNALWFLVDGKLAFQLYLTPQIMEEVLRYYKQLQSSFYEFLVE